MQLLSDLKKKTRALLDSLSNPEIPDPGSYDPGSGDNLGASWSEYLRYLTFEDDLFVVGRAGEKVEVDGFGFCIEITPQTGVDDDIADRLRVLFSENAPTGSGIQVQIFGTPKIDYYLDKASSIGEGHEEIQGGAIFKKATQYRMAHYRKLAKEPPRGGHNYLLREFRVLFSAVIPAEDENDAHAKKQAKKYLNTCVSILTSCGLADDSAWRIFDPQALINWCGDILNCANLLSEDRPTLTYNPLDLICKQIVLPTTEWKELPTHFEVTGYGTEPIEVTGMSVSHYPKSFQLFEMDELLGSRKYMEAGYPCPFLITTSISIPNYSQEKNRVSLRFARAEQISSTPIAKYMPHLGEQAKDWRLMQKQYDSGGGSLRLSHSVLLFSIPEIRSAAETQASSVWKNKGFQLQNDTRLQKLSLLSGLPMMMGKPMQGDMELFNRFQTKTFNNAANMLPIIADNAGISKSPIITLFGPRGRPIYIDIFDVIGGNYNVSCCGGSGSGKSVLINDIVKRHTERGGRAWMIDKGRSFEKFGENIGAQYIVFGKKADLSLNPFSYIRETDDEEDIADQFVMVRQIMAQMAYPTRSVNDSEAAILTTACMDAVARARLENIIADPDLVAEILVKAERYTEQNSTEARLLSTQMGLNMAAFMRLYGKYFRGKSTINFDAQVILLELEELTNRPDLQPAVMMSLVLSITDAMYLDRTQQKLVVIDEAWDLLGNASTSKFIESGYRRARKYRGSFTTATQKVEDYWTSESAAACFTNSGWKFLLRMTSEDVAGLIANERINIDSATKHMLNSMRTESGVYSDVLVINENSPPFIGKLFLDPYSGLMSSSKAEHVDAVSQLKQAGYSTDEALEYLVKASAAKEFRI